MRRKEIIFRTFVWELTRETLLFFFYVRVDLSEKSSTNVVRSIGIFFKYLYRRHVFTDMIAPLLVVSFVVIIHNIVFSVFYRTNSPTVLFENYYRSVPKIKIAVE